MLRLTIIVTLLFCLMNCSHSDDKPVDINKINSQPEPDNDLQEKYEAEQKVKKLTCIFDNPDTSVSGISLRFAESARKVLDVRRLNSDTTYLFYSAGRNEILSVKVHPGDGYSQVSIFQVKYAESPKLKASSSRIKQFTTEKGIRLGLIKRDVIAKLGNCYSIIDSTDNRLMVEYRLKYPQDSKTKLLERQSMPIYYATYKFQGDRLIEFEFGFEYP